jgi:O-acetylserine/cysteine efflux transporter
MNNRLLVLLSLTLPVVVIWGLNFAVIRVGVTNVGPFMLGAMRFAVASLPFLFFVPRPKVPFAFLLCYGTLFGFAQFAFLFVGMKIGLPTGIASLLLQLQAVFTPALAFLLLREPFSRYTAAAMAMSLAGLAAILSSAGHIEGGAVPVLFGVGAAACWAMSNVTVRFGVRKGYEYRPISLVVWASLLPVAPFLVLAWATGEVSPALWDGIGSGILSAIYLGVLGTVVGYMLWVRALSAFDAATVAPFSLMIPVIGLAAGYLIFDETLTRAEVAGSLLIVAGVFIHVVGTARRAPPPLP